MKLDDSVRCQSLTVFNTDTSPSCCYWSNSWGNSPWTVWKYKKRSDTSTLRVLWQGYVGWEFHMACIAFEIWINDEKCQDPYPIEAEFFQSEQGSGYGRTESGTRFMQGKTALFLYLFFF